MPLKKQSVVVLFLGSAHVNFLLNGHQSPAVHHPDTISVHLHLLTLKVTLVVLVQGSGPQATISLCMTEGGGAGGWA